MTQQDRTTDKAAVKEAPPKALPYQERKFYETLIGCFFEWKAEQEKKEVKSCPSL